MNVVKGISEPIPWWVDYFTSAAQANAKPWEMVDSQEYEDPEYPIPMRFWHRCALIVAEAEATAIEIQNKQGRK